MSSKTENSLRVLYSGFEEAIPVGRLALVNRKIMFEYSPEFLELGFELSPFKLPLKTGIMVCEDRVFEGLFGIFNDSLPDGWGRLLLDRKLMTMGINPISMTPLDRLRYVGKGGMGALQYEPEFPKFLVEEKQIELDALANECLQFQINDEDQYIDDLILLNGSSAGARPKILVSIDSKSDNFHLTDNLHSHNHNDWMIKFRSSVDPKDIGSIEYAYNLMAREAGIEIPEVKLFASRKCSGYFGVKRFDRTKNSFLHMHTLCGLLHADHRIPSLDYEAVLKATHLLTKNALECKKQFRHAVFNVFAHNRDDHSKNFSFLMDNKGEWVVSPAYDLTYSSGPGGEHCTTVAGNGRNPGTADLLKLAANIQIDPKDAQLIISEVRAAISKWSQFAKEAGASPLSIKNIEMNLSRT